MWSESNRERDERQQQQQRDEEWARLDREAEERERRFRLMPPSAVEAQSPPARRGE